MKNINYYIAVGFTLALLAVTAPEPSPDDDSVELARKVRTALFLVPSFEPHIPIVFGARRKPLL